VAVIYAGTKGYLDKVDMKDVGRWEAGLLSHMRGKGRETLDWITKEDPKIKGDAEEKLKAEIDAYAKTFS
jgi:F-type H+-transporting ATPase subunit alpha